MSDTSILGFVRLTATTVLLILCASAHATAQESTVTPLHTFTGAAGEGTHPSTGAALVEARDGSFYGVTQLGGTAGFGTIFRMTPDGTTTTLHSFTDPPQNPYSASSRDVMEISTAQSHMVGAWAWGSFSRSRLRELSL